MRCFDRRRESCNRGARLLNGTRSGRCDGRGARRPSRRRRHRRHERQSRGHHDGRSVGRAQEEDLAEAVDLAVRSSQSHYQLGKTQVPHFTIHHRVLITLKSCSAPSLNYSTLVAGTECSSRSFFSVLRLFFGPRHGIS